MNVSGKEIINKSELCSYMEDSAKQGKLIKGTINGKDAYILVVNENNIICMEIEKGGFIYTDAGTNKSNKRQYINLPLPRNNKFMCNNYSFRVICDGLLNDDYIHKDRYIAYRDGIETERKYTKKECYYRGIEYDKDSPVYTIDYLPSVINHINGDTEDNTDTNLEVVSKAMNSAHSRLMSEIAYHRPELIITEIDCQGNKMHRFADKIGISCKQISSWNARYKNALIRPFKNKDGEWQSHFTSEDIEKMLKYFESIRKYM